MLYVIGEYNKQVKFLSSLINYLQGYENEEEELLEKLPEKVKINTKYYTTEIQVRFWTIDEYLDLEYKDKYLYTSSELTAPISTSTSNPIPIPNPEAILLILSKKDLSQSNNNVHLLSLLDERYHPSNNEITRICCIIYDDDEEIVKEHDDLREKMKINCNQFNYELIILVSDTNNTLKQDDILFSFNEGTKRVTQALYCTHWKTMYRRQTIVPNLENNKHEHENFQYPEQDLENYLNNFEFLSSMIRKMTCDIKHLSDQERRERASNLICDLAKYLNLEEEEDNDDVGCDPDRDDPDCDDDPDPDPDPDPGPVPDPVPDPVPEPDLTNNQ